MNTNIFYLSTAVNCGTLSNLANGRVSHTAGTTFGQTATYSCNTGYNLVGNSTQTCQATGVWSGSAPTCQGVLSYISLFFLFTTSLCVTTLAVSHGRFSWPPIWRLRGDLRMRLDLKPNHAAFLGIIPGEFTTSWGQAT